jgi:hypothetical protein
VTLLLEDVSAETETSIEEDDKFAELSRSELEEFVAILSLLLAGGSSAGPELLESEEHAARIPAATIIAVAVMLKRSRNILWRIGTS